MRVEEYLEALDRFMDPAAYAQMGNARVYHHALDKTLALGEFAYPPPSPVFNGAKFLTAQLHLMVAGNARPVGMLESRGMDGLEAIGVEVAGLKTGSSRRYPADLR
ncbi:MAG: hypothetical protein AAGA56_18740 [Myxococcota bacterium]